MMTYAVRGMCSATQSTESTTKLNGRMTAVANHSGHEDGQRLFLLLTTELSVSDLEPKGNRGGGPPQHLNSGHTERLRGGIQAMRTL
jgi:hypothetical protein